MTAAQRDRMPAAMAERGRRDASTGASFRRLLTYLAPHRKPLIFSALLVVGASMFNLVGPWLQGVAIDDFIAEGDRSGLRDIVIVLTLTYLGAWLMGIIYGRIVAAVAQQVMAELREELFGKLQTLSMRFFDRTRTGDLMSRVTNDVDAVDQLLSQNLLSVVVSGLQIVSLLTIMTILDWRMTLAALLPVPLVLLLVGRIGKLTGPAFGAYQRDIGRLNSVAQERLGGQRAVIALHRQEHARKEFAEANETTRAKGITAQTLASIIFPLMFGLGNLSTVSVVGIGAWLAVTGDGNGVTIGLIASFVTYANRLGQPLGRIAGTVTSVFSALAGATRVFELLDEEPDLTDAPDAPALPPVEGRVVFDHVDFSYVEDQPILSDIDFVAEPGQMIGLVGPTGAGKSTIISVLNRFYDIDAGSVTVDGADIRSVRKDSLRGQLGIVLQRTFLFTDTVRANIRFGRLDATDEEIEAAARLANADHFIRALPLGYDEPVSERGSNLSSGQRQLIAIARAALANPRLLVLDEATSSVDTRTERDIQTALINLMEDRTSFVIAHRLSTVRDADQILVIQDGRITEAGTHEQLRELDGFYEGLYTAQFRGHG
ncbi:MAG: ABC transporter ATP-binding protein [Acidimicrobiales bacterium]